MEKNLLIKEQTELKLIRKKLESLEEQIVQKIQNLKIIQLKRQIGIFVAIGTASSSDLAKKLGVILDNKNNIIVNNQMETNIKGLYACGDCIGGILQIAKATYEGMIAGMSAIKYIKNEEEKNEYNK